MNKKGISSTVIFIILNVVFFAALFIFVGWAGANTSIKEQTYAKQIALLIDQAKPGTNLTIDISELYTIAEKNRYSQVPFDINYESNMITIKLVSGKGYSYNYFTSLKSGSVSIDEQKGLLKVQA